MPVVKTSPKGQVVVPAELRALIGLAPGDLVVVRHGGGRRVIVEPLEDDPIGAVRGMLTGGRSLTRALEREREAEHAEEAAEAARFLRGAGPPE